jgi:hypothetical protein
MLTYKHASDKYLPQMAPEFLICHPGVRFVRKKPHIGIHRMPNKNVR